MSSRLLLTKADDLGCFPAANRAIAHAVREGLCRNVGLMACTPAVEHAASLLAGCPDACFGLHATLNCEWDNWRWGPVLPTAQVPSLVYPDGSLKRQPMELHHGAASFDEAMAELAAQLHRARALGFEIRYLDCHMAFDWVETGPGGPRLQARLLEWARAEGLIFLRQAFDDPGKGSSFAVLPSGRALRLEHVFAKVDGTPLDDAEEALRTCPFEHPGILTRHPVDPDDQARAIHLPGRAPGLDAEQRFWEWQSFVDPRIHEACRERQLRPTRLDELAGLL